MGDPVKRAANYFNGKPSKARKLLMEFHADVVYMKMVAGRIITELQLYEETLADMIPLMADPHVANKEKAEQEVIGLEKAKKRIQAKVDYLRKHLGLH